MKTLFLCLVTIFLAGCIGGNNNSAGLPPELLVDQNPPSEIPVEENTNIPNLPDEILPEENSEPTENENTNPEPKPRPKPQVNPNQNSANETVEARDCEALSKELTKSFKDINFCEEDTDCRVVAGSCPFGCYVFHNFRLDFEEYQQELTTYQEHCGKCAYRCTAPPTDIKCIHGQCVDSSFDEDK